METVADIFAALGGPSAVARTLGVRQSTASEMKRRNSIPPEYWVRLVGAAQAKGIDDLSFERLAIVHAEARSKASASTAPEAA
ncbi:carph-isopro domain-containing protein [Methylobacterium organophilum]|uniref:carph-isopro domain-containing protein n=1 Tax=Methylobacterium organophilum TaxID=410 RepID=UPI0035716754